MSAPRAVAFDFDARECLTPLQVGRCCMSERSRILSRRLLRSVHSGALPTCRASGTKSDPPASPRAHAVCSSFPSAAGEHHDTNSIHAVWPITFTLLGTFALSIGLTFRSNHYCYAGTCGEWLFPLQARLHVIVWYFWISISVAVLGFRAFHPGLRKLLGHHITSKEIPKVGKHLAVSGVLIICWIIALYGIVVGIWWIRLHDYFAERGNSAGVSAGNYRLAAIALTGHMCDVTMGMVLLPISRHSALASFFKISVSTTLTFHMFTAYTLFTLVVIHGLLYISWIPIFTALSENLKHVYPVFNPTYLYHEVWPGNTSSLGIWRASLIFTGFFTAAIMMLIFVTTLPSIRRKHFNLFYFSHLLIIVAVVVICLHASTMFYITSPGLVLWIVDWLMRVFELWQPINSNVTTIGNGYYLLNTKIPRNRLRGCACTSPLAHFYIYHSDSSLRELHPFTTITHLASANAITPPEEPNLKIQFLFRKRVRHTTDIDTTTLSEKTGFSSLVRTLTSPKTKQKAQWTEKLAGIVDTEISRSSRESLSTKDIDADSDYRHPSSMIDLRLEGPYFTPADPYRHRTVICLVAGTGISGGIAIARAFMETKRQEAESIACGNTLTPCVAAAQGSIWDQCIVVWSVRAEDYVEIPFFKNDEVPGLEIEAVQTGGGRPRMDAPAKLASILKHLPDGEPLLPPKANVKMSTTAKPAVSLSENEMDLLPSCFRHMTTDPQYDWSAIAAERKYKSAAVAKAAFRRLKRKLQAKTSVSSSSGFDKSEPAPPAKKAGHDQIDANGDHARSTPRDIPGNAKLRMKRAWRVKYDLAADLTTAIQRQLISEVNHDDSPPTSWSWEEIDEDEPEMFPMDDLA
ncbi:hypothetical protein FH972_024206 [Carpinus fangiana]|uniref:Ferric oxidoreductase domain-containing protein n=1 Tax=Carpinus fangiana TaxID=176857 RepID=A0A5N6KZW3_9ROSI|nr:hypothetical protein FH972_024206 [Carpinus fangiana]